MLYRIGFCADTESLCCSVKQQQVFRGTKTHTTNAICDNFRKRYLSLSKRHEKCAVTIVPSVDRRPIRYDFYDDRKGIQPDTNVITARFQPPEYGTI